MKVQEFKLMLLNKLYTITDEWFDTNTLQDRFINGTLKTIIKANKNKYDNLINMFADENGDIDLSEMRNQLINVIPERIEMDVNEITSKWNIPSYLIPNKLLLLTRKDILDILKLINKGYTLFVYPL